MIACVRFAALHAYLRTLGFDEAGRVGNTLTYTRDRDLFTVRVPNENGDLAEAVVNDALDAACLPEPDWPVHWCD